MSGMYVSCGSFEGGDKSASALDILLEHAPARVVQAIQPVFDDCHVSVPVPIAALLLQHAKHYRAALVARLGHDDPIRADREDREAGETRLRRGTSWELSCANDVIRACETSAAEQKPVVFEYF